jgi:hypothetical protein
MATATTIEIAADSRGVKTGLVDANRALDETTKKADRATKSVDKLGTKSKAAGKNMSAAFAATGGGLSVTHGLAGMASGFRSADSSMVAFAASQALLDMGRMAEDMKGVAGATGTTATAFGRLKAVMKAHPIMFIAGLLATAAGAMAIFANDTDDAKESVDALGEAIKDLEARSFTQIALSGGKLSGAAPRLTALGKGYQDIERRDYQTQYNVAEVHRMSGVPQSELWRQGREMGAPISAKGVMSRDVAQALLKSVYSDLQSILAIERQGGATFGITATGMPKVRSDALYGPPAPGIEGPSATASVASAAQSISQQITAWYGDPLGPPAPQTAAQSQALSPQQLAGMPGTPNWNMAAFDQQAFGSMGGQGVFIDEQHRAELMAAQQQSMAEANQHMQELIMQGEQFGQTIGDAFMRVAEGTMTARQAMAELVRQFAQMASSSIFRQIGGAVAGSFAPTQTQGNQNLQVPGGSQNSGG